MAWGLLLAGIAYTAGCSQAVHHASSLPPEVIAPAPPALDTIRLSNLVDRSANRQEIQPDDVLEVSILTDFSQMRSTTTPVRVAVDGTVNLPLIGKVVVAGIEPAAAERVVAEASVARGLYRNPCVTVTLKQRRTNRITVVGAINQPGIHELPRGDSSLLAAVVAAGGLSKDASLEVEIRHVAAPWEHAEVAGSQIGSNSTMEVMPVSSQQVATAAPPLKVNLLTLTANGERPPELNDGDVVQVVKRDVRPIYVMGLVRKPGEFELPPNRSIRLLDALAMAGDCSSSVADRVQILRQVPGRPGPEAISATIRGARNGPDNLQLAPGDVITVEQTPVTVVVDTIQTFFRVGFSAAIPSF